MNQTHPKRLNQAQNLGTNRKFRENIGPSHYSTILGYNQFKTAEELQNELETGVPKKTVQNFDAINMGINKENEVLKLYEKEKGVKVKKAPWVRQSRILGKADGLIDADGGLEIKCHYNKEHPLSSIPIYYLVQILGYLHLYKRQWWDMISCCISDKGEIMKYRIHRVYWKNFSKSWEDFWYPQIEDFVKTVKWQIEAQPDH